MKKKLIPVFQGLSGLLFGVFAIGAAAGPLTTTWRSTVDSVFGQNSYFTDTENMTYESDYSTPKALVEAAKDFAIREGEEGTVVMKNDNSVLPLASGTKVAMFGTASYATYYSQAGNSDAISLVDALATNGITNDATLSAIYTGITSKSVESTNDWGVTTVSYPYGPQTSNPDYINNFDIHEVNPSLFTNSNVAGDGAQSVNWENNVDADIGIVTICRPGGETATYRPGATSQWSIDENGNVTEGATILDQDPLALGPDELEVIDLAKSLCDKVVVLLNTAVAMDIGPLVDSKWNVDSEDTGDHTVDGIVYIGVPNDYQLQGVANVLTGKVNATGALNDTFAVKASHNPAMQNFGGGAFEDYLTVTSESMNDTRWSGITNHLVPSSFAQFTSYNAALYLIEAESIYTGYTYYETRYYDGVLNQGNALSTTGSLTGSAWSYDEEVIYPFGYGLSYLDYEEKLTEVTYEARGDVTATIEVTNNSETDGTFRTELFVQSPYSDYDKTNGVEKSAAQFLNSAKVDVAAGATETVTITVPSKYLASYDSNGAETYILDGGDYYFAIGNGSHEAVNNILTKQGHLTTGDTDKSYIVSIGTGGEVDTRTYALSDSGAVITNQVEDVDSNYWFDEEVTYLTRNDWEGTYPEEYTPYEGYNGEMTEVDSNAGYALPVGKISLADLKEDKKDEFYDKLLGREYTYNFTSNGDDVENWDGITGTTWADVSASGDYTDPEAQVYEDLVNAIPAIEAVGAILHGGSASDTLSNIENPIVVQNDGPTGFTSGSLGEITEEASPYYFTADGEYAEYYGWAPEINSQTNLACTFNPEMASEWGKILGNTGLWTGRYEIWGGGLNYHRTQYNGRNVEYLSEDPMLTNRLGAALIEACNETGVICAPKHIGFNDQEYDRSGIQVYMNEQKFRETDMRAFQGAIEDSHTYGVMVAFNRLGPTNATQYGSMLNDILRGEWAFNGIVSSDMCLAYYYFSGPDAIMGGTTMLADFAQGDSTIEEANDKCWTYITRDNLKYNNTLVETARQNLKYQFYAFANSAVLNISTYYVMPGWEIGLKTITWTSFGLAILVSAAWIGLHFMPAKVKE